MADVGVRILDVSPRVRVALGPVRSGRPLANTTVIAGERETAVVDTMIAPAMLVPVREAARELGGGRDVGFVINTHGDPDHLLGNGLFPEAVIVAHAQVVKVLTTLETRERYQQMLTTQAEGEQRQDVLAALHVREPDVTFDQELTLRLGGVSAQLQYVGPAHSVADSIVWLAEERLLVAADIVFNGLFPLVRDDLDNWFAGLERASKLEPAVVVPGHGDIGGPELLTRQLEVLTAVRDAVKGLYAAGTSVEAAASEPPPAPLRSLPLADERWPNAVRGIYGVLERNAVVS